MRALILILALHATAFAAPPSEDGRAIVFIVDRALSPEKIEVVRQAVKEAAYAGDDQFGVIAYGAKATTVRSLRGKRLGSVVSTTNPTNLTTGLDAAGAMLAKSKRGRLVIVFTDRDDDDFGMTIAKLRADAITVSAICVDCKSDALARIARAGKGRHYATDSTVAVAIALQKELRLPPPGQERSAFVFVVERSVSRADLELAKALAQQHLEAIGPNDMLAVIGLDSQATFYMRPQRAANRMRISHDISRLTPSVGKNETRIGLQLALETLDALNTNEKHVVLYRIGDLDTADISNAMASANITLSVVSREPSKLKMR